MPANVVLEARMPNVDLHKRGKYGQRYLGFAKMYLELLELLLELLLQTLLELLLLLLLFSLPRTWWPR